MRITSAEKLLSHWKRQGLVLAKGNAETRLIEFETTNSLRLPSDMRQYLSVANGMPSVPGSDVDPNGFRFWPLEHIRCMPTVCAEAGVPSPAVKDPQWYFVFADYFDWSWAYAIDLSRSDSGSQPIIHVGTLAQKIVAHSFGEFVDLYIQDSRDLHVLADDHQSGKVIRSNNVESDGCPE